MSLIKNVPTWERVIRVAGGLAAAVAGAVMAAFGLWLWGAVVGVSGLGFAVTGMVGWCPACAAVGRTLPPSARTIGVAKL